MEKQQQLKHSRIGNTKLLLVNCEDILNTARTMLANGDYFFQIQKKNSLNHQLD